MRGEQGLSGPNHLVDQGTFGGAGGHRVDTAQQQRVVRKQQTALGHLGNDGGGCVDCDGDRIDRLHGITAHQTHRIPILRQRGRIRRLEHVDDVGQPDTHRSTSAIASTSTGHSRRTATRRY